MKKTNYDIGWRFSLNGQPEIPVNLPHDFSIGRDRSADSRMTDKGGFFPGGDGVYRKTLVLDTTSGRHVLEIEGAYQLAEVFVNGNLAATNHYGYTSFHVELTPWLIPGDNAIEIHVRNNALPNSRWYSGSGLYRHVWLLTAPDAYIEPWGVFATTPEATAQQAIVRIQTDASGAGTLRHTLLDASGTAVATAQSEAAVGQNVQQLVIESVRLWDVDDPYLYTLRSELLVGGAVVDTVQTPIGIRTIALDAGKGFLLNGRSIKLKGGCVHHDCGILGSAAYDRAEERKVLAHKQAGYNAIRCAHNPPSPAFLDACDRLGILVMDEAFDCWRMGKTDYDYHLFFEAHWKKDLAAMVLRDRNHPCIAFWSTGNEIVERLGRSDGYAWSATLAAAVRELDDTRFVSNALCIGWGDSGEPSDWGEATAPFAAPLDVVGYNYLWRRYEEDLVKYPQRFIYSTETIAGEAFENWNAVLANPRVIGDCVWTSMDYIGESGIGHAFLPDEDARTHGLGYPWHLANCGDLDICCRPRPQSYYRQILWGHRAAPWIAVHRPNTRGLKAQYNFWGWGDVQHSWSWPGADGYTTHVDVYSAADEVELFLNGASLGKRPAGAAGRNIASFELPYATGELRAVAYTAGKPSGEDVLETCRAPVAIALHTDRPHIDAAWGDLCYVTATVVDAQGNPVPYAENDLLLSAAGAGELIAIGTNDPVSTEPYVGSHRRAFEGTVVAVVRSTGAAGEITLTAAAEGLRAAQITITTK